MKIDRPPRDAPDEAWQDYVVKIHECVEEGRTENRAAFKRIRFDGNVNVVAMAMLLIAVITAGVSAVQWADSVNAKLGMIPTLQGRLDTMQNQINDIHNWAMDRRAGQDR